jgi:hypothetical protein
MASKNVICRLWVEQIKLLWNETTRVPFNLFYDRKSIIICNAIVFMLMLAALSFCTALICTGLMLTIYTSCNKIYI